MNSLLAAKILLVDDEEEFIDLMSQRLETRGLKVEAVSSGEAAVAAVADHSFDVAIVDLAMPGIDGIETLKQIKNERPDVEVIMLTGQATVKSGIEAMKHGASDFLEKPVDLNVLMEKIRAAKSDRMRSLKSKSAEELKNILKSKSW
ncbi:CheY-like receiver, AAA-type ATPase and DNA-binding domain-containing response regulator [Desulfocapsa sulfexigens DSM 10523]|uniref:CheY-like receiver, AAA-type ATPase and DNA-binding domain-containing response regulator n=1 Tax=Desulfocapsa sulfexigens (strain DSM 10523 / SB164P1) TaxID=1167006 RepID=M1PFR1_DESSD|nr:response regulator [Desulfocapsa sulfexigens]AGF78495.1 CheY-like receiver, AAA-type ATPase and DNA-binding domain-containing response regulator [Desulfocapsa sulfexigens DSM 10523]